MQKYLKVSSSFPKAGHSSTGVDLLLGGGGSDMRIDFVRGLAVMGLPWWLRQWKIHLQCGRPGFNPWVRKIPWRRAWQPTPVFLSGESSE